MHSDSRILSRAVKTRQIWLINFKLPDTLDCNTTGWNNRHRQIVLLVSCIPDILELHFHGTLVHHGGPFLPVDLNGGLHLHRSLIDLRCRRLLRPKIIRIFWLLRWMVEMTLGIFLWSEIHIENILKIRDQSFPKFRVPYNTQNVQFVKVWLR